MLKITLLFSVCGRLKLFIQWPPSHFVILQILLNTYMDFPSNTTIYCNKATFWQLYYSKRMAVLGGKSYIVSVLKFLSSTLPITVIECANFTFFKRGIPNDSRYLCQPLQKCNCGVSCDCYTLVKFPVNINPYLLHKICDFNKGTLF